MVHPPTVIGLLVCEQLIVDKDTNNLSIINCFTRRKIESFPSAPQRFAVVALFTDGEGDFPMELLIQRLDTLEVVERYPFALRFTDRLQEVRFLFRVAKCVFPAAGAYDVSLLSGEESLARHRIFVG